jgi:hypothetical protein
MALIPLSSMVIFMKLRMTSLFIEIDLLFGSFDVASAEAIDLTWNWVVGKGFQGLLPLSYELSTPLSPYPTKPDVLRQ